MYTGEVKYYGDLWQYREDNGEDFVKGFTTINDGAMPVVVPWSFKRTYSGCSKAFGIPEVGVGSVKAHTDCALHTGDELHLD